MVALTLGVVNARVGDGVGCYSCLQNGVIIYEKTYKQKNGRINYSTTVFLHIAVFDKLILFYVYTLNLTF